MIARFWSGNSLSTVDSGLQRPLRYSVAVDVIRSRGEEGEKCFLEEDMDDFDVDRLIVFEEDDGR